MGFYQFMERYDIPTVVLRLLLTAVCSGIMGTHITSDSFGRAYLF